ncbi:MAG: class I SAM-dependent methyltransferase [Candidatus Adiutrix sp.]|nr:class I SAM-dependent methyltransferase [Candidatus Adiutrix sp.]
MAARTNPYEGEELRAVCGETLRPGGLAVTRDALEFCHFRPGARLLDVGCGPGGTLKFLKEMGYEAVGVEKSPLLAAEARAQGPVWEADFHHLPLADNWAEGLVAECVLSLALDPEQALAEWGRVLQPGGRLILSDVILKDGAAPLPPATDSGCLAGAVTLTTLINRLERGGYALVHQRDYGQAWRELAAQLVWRYGSADILRQLWAREAGDSCGCFRGRDFTYGLLIAQKEEQP